MPNCIPMNTLYQIPVTLKTRLLAFKAAFPAVVALFLFSLLMIRTVHAQGPVVAIGSATSCTSGTAVTVPITVQNFTNIGAVSLDMLYDSTKLTYTGFNSAALSGNLIVNNPGPVGSPFGRVLISWFSLTSANIGSGLLMNLTFTANGSSTVNWNTAVVGQCELADGNGDVISNAVFTNGSVTVGGAAISTQPVSNLSLANGASGSLSVVASGASSYQWQVSVAGGAWTNLSNGGGYSGVTTSTLGIVATSAMNGNQYRVLVASTGCSDLVSSVSSLSVSSPVLIPSVTTTAVTSITANGATTGGNVTSDGGAAVTARGVAYGTGQNPSISGAITSNGAGTGAFSSTLTGLTASTAYNVRAYATNSVGTAYGSQVSFTTTAPPATTVTLGQVSGCRGSVVTVPITVQNFTNIGAVSLDLLYDSTKLTYAGNNSSALTGNLIVNNPVVGGVPQGRILISWFDLNSSNIGNGLMLNLTFTVNGTSAISWNTAVAGQCELADGNGDVISNAVFSNGSVTATGAQITAQPASSLSLNAGASGSLTVVASGASSYQWQVSVAGGAWTNLSNGGGYSGVTSATLEIVAASSMNGNQYRVQVSGGGCSPVTSSSSALTVVSTGGGMNATVKVLLEGAYIGNGEMLPALYDIYVNNGLSLADTPDPDVTDTLTISLWDPADLSVPVYSQKHVLRTNSECDFTLPGSYSGQSYWISVNHRSSLEIWSSSAVVFSNNVVYDFTSDLTNTFNDGFTDPQIETFDGKYVMISGDVNQDGNIEGADANQLFSSQDANVFDLLLDDITFDGYVDLVDYNQGFTNSGNSPFFARPY